MTPAVIARTSFNSIKFKLKIDRQIFLCVIITSQNKAITRTISILHIIQFHPGIISNPFYCSWFNVLILIWKCFMNGNEHANTGRAGGVRPFTPTGGPKRSSSRGRFHIERLIGRWEWRLRWSLVNNFTHIKSGPPQQQHQLERF